MGWSVLTMVLASISEGTRRHNPQVPVAVSGGLAHPSAIVPFFSPSIPLVWFVVNQFSMKNDVLLFHLVAYYPIALCPADPRLPPPPSPNHTPCPADQQLSPPPAPHHARLASPNHGVGDVLERRGEAVLGRQAVVHGRHDRRAAAASAAHVLWNGAEATRNRT